jgi:ABC-type molybdate transport system substrate-binding protein
LRHQFQDTFIKLADAYRKGANEQIDATYGATGMLYDQIIGGSKFAALFGADDVRTAQLVDAKRARPASRFIYAIGHLTLWVPGATAPPDPTAGRVSAGRRRDAPRMQRGSHPWPRQTLA